MLEKQPLLKWRMMDLTLLDRFEVMRNGIFRATRKTNFTPIQPDGSLTGFLDEF
jgi:hypothetical protein